MPTMPDGNPNFVGGQDASKSPDIIGPDTYAAGINLRTDNGSLQGRWGWVRHNLDFQATGAFSQRNKQVKGYSDLFRTGKFQALIPYSIGKTYYTIIVISGTIYLVNQKTLEVRVIEITGGADHLNEFTNRLYWTEASKYLVIFDYPNTAVIIEGATARRANLDELEIPVSKLGTYNQSRLFIGNAGNEFTAGDPVGALGTNGPITFIETLTPGSDYFGQVFQLSTSYNNNPLTAMTFLQASDTSLGVGNMLAATKQAIWSYAAQNRRSDWEQGQFGSILLYNVGIAGGRAFTHVHSDMAFMSGDGQMRFLSMSREDQQKWSKVSESLEVKNWLKFFEKELCEFAALGYFKNKIFVTANPYRTIATSRDDLSVSDYAHGGFAVMELDNMTSTGSSGRPVWAGLWTGVRPMDIIVNDDRCFVMAKDEDGTNQLYELRPDKTYDVIDGVERYFRSRVYTRAYDFQQYAHDKILKSIELELTSLQGDIQIDAAYKPFHGSTYVKWGSWNHKAPYQTSFLPKGNELSGFAKHSLKRVKLGSPDEDGENTVTNDTYSHFRKMQVRLDITARHWELKSLVLNADIQAQDDNSDINREYEEISIFSDFNDDWRLV